MNAYFHEILPDIKENWGKINTMFTDVVVPARTTLLREGEIASNFYFINQGCLRMWFNDDGRDITFQFFFEQQLVSSFERFYNNEPSLFNLEALETSNITIIKKDDFQ